MGKKITEKLVKRATNYRALLRKETYEMRLLRLFTPLYTADLEASFLQK